MSSQIAVCWPGCSAVKASQNEHGPAHRAKRTGENRGAILLKREIVARRFVRGADPLVEEVDDADLGGGG